MDLVDPGDLTDSAGLPVLHPSCLASILLLEQSVHRVLQLLMALQQKSELPANGSAAGPQSGPPGALTELQVPLVLLEAAGLHHVLHGAPQLVQLRSEGGDQMLEQLGESRPAAVGDQSGPAPADAGLQPSPPSQPVSPSDDPGLSPP